MPFQKGHPQFNTGKTHFKKGHIPWITGKKHSLKTRKKMRANYKYHIPKIFRDISGKNNPRWNNGVYIDKNGYKKIFQPMRKKYIFEHRLIMEKHLERLLKPEEVVHHINGDNVDNRIENLKLFKNKSEHRKFHWHNISNYKNKSPLKSKQI